MSRASRTGDLLAGGLLMTSLSLTGCATLPVAGPNAADIARAQRRLADFDLIVVDAAAIGRINAAPPPAVGRLAALADDGTMADVIGPGDVLQITVYEVGAPLFGTRVSAGEFATGSAAGEALPLVTVARDGRITVPWVPAMMAAGKTTDQLASALRAAYRRNSENPQVMVALRENVANTIIVQGDVKKPGRLPLTLARERLLDAIAIAGGVSGSTLDAVVKVNRGGQSAEEILAAIEPGTADDLRLLPQDRISVTFRPRTFTILGATGKVSEIPFQAPRVSLIEAIGRGGGPSDDRADPAAVFVFRYEPSHDDGAPGAGARPVAYKFNMRQPESYFLAQRFALRPRDVIYIATARATLPAKAIQLLSQFFSPVYTAKVLSQ